MVSSSPGYIPRLMATRTLLVLLSTTLLPPPSSALTDSEERQIAECTHSAFSFACGGCTAQARPNCHIRWERFCRCRVPCHHDNCDYVCGVNTVSTPCAPLLD
ncbi:hypothetical protein RRG08_049634 [Elysia crispata]|uniref:Uncharacterized protein n=1 Tax=Elysia crispata TaxID=231223 RepID=A0AAE1BC86_9GAST|nr:hypothetical protein RRG08_049634 [Elysia crispata]